MRIPVALRHPLSLIGVALTTAMAVLFCVLLLAEGFGLLRNPYLGLLLFVTIPVVFVAGLLLIPIGARLDARRRRRHPEEVRPEWPVLDLNVARQRRWIAAGVGLTIVNLVILSMASYGAVHYMESTAFCGEVCHETMEPEATAHRSGAHARVPCVSCHVGPGTGALIESKIAGTRQLFHVLTNTVTKPVPTPVRRMRNAQETCAGCHWPDQWHGDTTRVIREYADDEQNSETVTTLTLKVGGGSTAVGSGAGIHWHMNPANQIEYIATDAGRETIPWVQLRGADGTVQEFVVEGVSAEQLAAGERRRMDCLDCHNRPAHTFQRSAVRAVDEAMARGLIATDLPFAHRETVAAISAAYPDRAAALQAIADRLRAHYLTTPSAEGDQVTRAIAAAQQLWATNVFPAMRVGWGTYGNNLGHDPAPGCFRCHDDEHRTRDGRTIGQDCELCHTMS